MPHPFTALSARGAKWPVPARHEHAATWLQAWEDLVRAPRTLDAYARGLAQYLSLCEREGVDPLVAGWANVWGCSFAS